MGPVLGLCPADWRKIYAKDVGRMTNSIYRKHSYPVCLRVLLVTVVSDYLVYLYAMSTPE